MATAAVDTAAVVAVDVADLRNEVDRNLNRARSPPTSVLPLPSLEVPLLLFLQHRRGQLLARQRPARHPRSRVSADGAAAVVNPQVKHAPVRAYHLFLLPSNWNGEIRHRRDVRKIDDVARRLGGIGPSDGDHLAYSMSASGA